VSTDIKSTAPSASVTEARRLMRTYGVHHLLVRDGRRIAEPR
jgi:CBS domain-containing protein